MDIKTDTPIQDEIDNISKEFEDISHKLQKSQQEISNHIFGQDDVITYVIATILSGGHAIILGLPGLAKTKLVHIVSKVFGFKDSRIQFTPDLMPSDILGSEILEQSKSEKHYFRFIKGPIFTQLLMADEINRASPRTQSALLQAMQEKKVTIAGQDYDLDNPFHVLATQNPIEHEGTYPLPEAQLDRFMMEIDISYPDLESEMNMLISTTINEEAKIKNIMSVEDVLKAQKIIRKMPVGKNIAKTILNLIRSARPGQENSNEISKHLLWGPGPRATQSLTLATKSLAMLEGRLSPSLEDIKKLAYPTLKHRISLSYMAQTEGQTKKSLIDELVKNIDKY